MVVIDIIMLVGAFGLGYLARNHLPFLPTPVDPPPFYRYIPMMAVHVSAILILFYFSRMYHLHRAISRFDVDYAIAQNVSIGTLLAVAIETLAFKHNTLEIDYPRGVIVYAWVFGIIGVAIGRELHRQLLVLLHRSGIWQDRTLIVGTGDVAIDIADRIRHAPHLGYEVVGFVPRASAADAGEKLPAGASVVGAVKDLPALIDENQIQAVVVAVPGATRSELLEIVTLCQRGMVDIKIFPDVFAFISSGLTVDELGGVPFLGVQDIALRGWKLSLKRGLDVVGSTVGLIFLSPIFAVIAAWISISDRGPVFFHQERVGLDGKPFQLKKFRTMRVDAEEHGRWTVEDDPRVTKVGSFLRSTNLDELPNLVNVFKGEMSLVGPRPEQVRFVEEFRERIPRYMERHREKSGMTGWAQIHGLRGDTSIEERLKYDLHYVENWSLWLDVEIILRTVLQTLFLSNKNAY
jgi:exopolysaccharide biosynthesis polyprenyl glycosylphosphotransferase